MSFSGIRRYLRLYGYFLRFSFSRSAEFRIDFLFRIVMDFLYYGAHFVFFSVLFRHSPTIGGWNQHQMNLFLGTIFLVDGLHMTLFSNNLWPLPMLVNKGDFDYYVLRPVSSLFMVSLRDVAINSAVNLLGAIVLMIVFIVQSPDTFGFLKLFTYASFVICGLMLSFLLRMLCILPVFWTQSPRGLENFYFSLTHVSERPDRIYTGWVRRTLTTVLPFGLIYSYPARILADAWSWPVFFRMIGVTGVFAMIIAFLWNRATQAYGSASS